MFSCEYYRIFKSTYFEERLQTATPATSLYLRSDQKWFFQTMFCQMFFTRI